MTADRIGPAGLASLLLHGGAVLALLAAVPPARPPAPLVVEMAFLPPAEAPAAEDATAAESPPPAEAGAEPADAPPTLAEPIAEPVAEPVAALAEPIPEEPALEAVAEPPPEPRPAPEPAPTPPRPQPVARAARPRATPRATPGGGGTAPAAEAAPRPAAAPAAAAPPRAMPPGYIAALFAALERRKEYPESARWRRAEGIAILRVLLRRDGSVQAWRIERGTGHEDLDQAVGGMVRRASPLPAPPADWPGETVEFSIPVRFSLR